MSSANEIRQTFFQECDELLEALDDGLVEINDSISEESVDVEAINSVFRAVHSIKGGAAAFGLQELVDFAHKFETVLDSLRGGELTPDEWVLKVCHRAADHLNDLVVVSRDGGTTNVSVATDLCEKLESIISLKGGDAVAERDSRAVKMGNDNFEFDAIEMELPCELPQRANESQELLGSRDYAEIKPAEVGAEAVLKKTYEVLFQPSKEMYASGNDTTLIFRELSELGKLRVTAITEDLPRLKIMNCEESYLSWSVMIETEASDAELREVFEFVEGLCNYKVTQISGDRFHIENVEKPSADASRQLKEAVLETGQHAAETCTSASESVVDSNVENTKVSENAFDKGIIEGATKTRPVSAGPKATVRVNLDLVDRLINMVGELVINQAVLTQCVNDSGLMGGGELSNSLAEFRNLARDIQESVMAIRAQSVKPLFQRMARIVRESSEIACKEVEFVTQGEGTEVDKTIIERLVDPLTHMIRNAVDHGLESGERRKEVGKSQVGRITLSAAHKSGRVLIEVSDDGAGIDRSKVFDIAVQKGLISPDSNLKEAETDNLLFLPGFSTANEVSNLSGRGVGLDVVRSAIQKLGGRVSVSSTPGQGTKMSISLPLTLAVLDGMVVDVAGQTMVVPITAIVETLRPRSMDIHPLGADNTVVAVRGKLVPVVDLGAVFGHRCSVVDVSEMVLLLVESEDSKHWALAVDQIFDQRQVVIKGLEVNYGHVPGVAAATILGDGNIALIIDPEETARQAVPDPDKFDQTLIEEVT